MATHLTRCVGEAPVPADERFGPMSFGLFQREQRSLFGEILDWMLTPLLLLWPLSLALTWFVAQGIASKPFDRALEFNLLALTQFVVAKDNVVNFHLTPQARDLLRADDSDLVYYQVLDPRSNLLISGEGDFPLPQDNETPEPGRVMLRDDTVRGDDVRVAYAWLSRTSDPRHLVLMQVAETKGKRSTLATEIIKGVMVPQFVILPLAVLLVWLALVRGIRPAQRSGAAHPRPQARRPEPHRRVVHSPGSGATGVVDQRPAHAPQSLAHHPETLSGRCGPPAQDAAGGPAHAGRTGPAGKRPAGDPGLAAADRPLQHARHPHRQPAARPGPRRDHRAHLAHGPDRSGTPGDQRGARLGSARAGTRRGPGLRRPRQHAAPTG